jgi:hypothetical protein
MDRRERMAALTRRNLLAAGLAGLAGVARSGCAAARPAEVAVDTFPYVDPSIMEKLPFGTHSHMLQPWRSYLDTVPASDFLRGLGLVLDADRQVPDLALAMAARCGIAHARMEIAWDRVSWDDARRLADDSVSRDLHRLLVSCRRNAIRPLICLNANHGMPCPSRVFTRHATVPASAGARTLTLDSAADLVIGRSGLSNLTDYWAAEVIVVGIEGNTISLSKPLPVPMQDGRPGPGEIKAGQPLTFATLKYEPFSEPGSARNAATMAGWLEYVDAVAAFVTAALGTADAADKGFDLEIWNELSFGSKFLSIDNYYEPKLFDYDESTIWDDVVARTVEHLDAGADRFAGVVVTNGFASTVPWPASSLQPPRVSALSKHPYPPRYVFPQDEQRNTKNLDCFGRATSYVPHYRAYFPEYYATAIQTETIVRDMGPRTDDIYGKKHGRYARRIDGAVRPVRVWLTEMGVNPREARAGEGSAAALKMKATIRALLFYLNAGAERLYLYSACGGDAEYGIIADRFIDYAKHHATYPSDETAYLSPTLAVLRRIVAHMRGRIEGGDGGRRQLAFATREEPGSAVQVPGDAALGIAPLRNVDALVLLPYQLSNGSFIVAYYAMTRDIRVEMKPEEMTIDVGGVDGLRASVSAYDPVRDESHSPRVAKRRQDGLTVTLSVLDYPRLLVLRDRA